MFVDFLLFIESQFTTRAPVTSVHQWARQVMDFRTLQQVPGRFEWFDGHKKCIGEVCCIFSWSRIAYVRYFKGPYVKKMGYVVAHLVEALRYKPECRGFDSR
jgi:succinate dehydrogenase/fumarate reductase-like Fe-S protein